MNTTEDVRKEVQKLSGTPDRDQAMMICQSILERYKQANQNVGISFEHELGFKTAMKLVWESLNA